MAASSPAREAPQAHDVFISYSRKDKEFVRRLEEALQARGRQAWVDWEGIRPTEEFMQAIYRAIEGADTFIFVLSPDSVCSKVCAQEIAHAVAQNKRMVPLVAREVNAADVPDALAKLNWIFGRDTDPFDAATDTLISALDTDLDWVRAHTRLLTRAIEWEAKGKNNSFVLRGDDLREAEKWLAEAGTDKERQPTALQTEYIIASRKAETARQRTIRTWVAVAALVAIVLAVAAVIQAGKARAQERKAKSENSLSEYLHALSLVESSDADEALRTLAQSLELDSSNSFAATRLINLLGQRQWPHLAGKQTQPLAVQTLKTNADASRIILATGSAGYGMQMQSQAIHLYDTVTLRAVENVKLDCYSISDLKVSGDRVLAAGLPQGTVTLFDAKTAWQVQLPAQIGQENGGCTFSNDRQLAVVWDLEGAKAFSAADGRLLFQIPNLAGPIRAVTGSAAELRLLFNDGSVTIHPLKGAEPAPAQSFPVVQDLPPFADFVLGGTFVLGADGRGVRCWPVSPAAKGDARSIDSKGFAMFAAQSDLTDKITVSSQGESTPVTLTVQQPWYDSSSGGVRSCLTQFTLDNSGTSELLTDWHSSYAPICLLAPSIVVAEDTKAFVLPFHGGSLSGPLRHEAQMTALCGVKEGLVATGSSDGTVKLWQLTPPIFPAATQSGPVTKKGSGKLRFQSRTHDLEVWEEESGDCVLRRGGQRVKIQLPSELFQQGISSIELSGDGELAIISGFRGAGRGGAGSGAWVFAVKDGRLLSGRLGPCEWAGFGRDRSQVLMIEFGRLTFWNLRPDKDGMVTFEPTPPTLAQANMTGAEISADGHRVATFSASGEVIVWDKSEAKPLRSLRRDPLWSDPNLDSSAPNPNEDLRAQSALPKPAFRADGKALAAAYGTAFAVWDVESGQPLSDPIFCAGKIQSLEFSADDPAKVVATLQDGGVVSWDHAELRTPLAGADVTALCELARAVANDQWVDKAPELAAEKHPASPVVAELLKHFADQARALRGNAQ